MGFGAKNLNKLMVDILDGSMRKEKKIGQNMRMAGITR